MSPWEWVRHYLPEGRGLPQQEWRIRHRAVLVFIFGHAVGLPIFGLARGWPPGQALLEGALIAAVGLVAALPQLSRKARSALAALGCVLSSAILVQFWGGVIEAHFHFFVVVALISLYQDWLPFLLSIVFVALDHGLTGVLLPNWVFNHNDALSNPWGWAIIHAVFVLAECVALVVVWRANEQARAETDRVLRSTGEGLVGVDGDCVVTFANRAALEMCGLQERDLLGRPLYGILRGGDDRPAFAPDVLRQNPGAFSSEAWVARPDGMRVPVEVLCTPIEGRAHQEGAVVAIRDMTERVRAEVERTEAAKQTHELEQLREVNSFKARFMNMAAHELNTPLTPIKVQMHLLKARAADGPGLEPHKNSITILDRNFNRLSGLVQDLLDSTRLQTNRLPTTPRPMDLVALLREVVDSFQSVAQGAKIQLELDTVEPLQCNADPQRLTQVLNNLLVNAIKFTPAGGKVRVVARLKEDIVRVEVRDTGIGLAPDQIARLFQPFEQVHESQLATHHGSGLGLYITRGIVESHAGRVWAESAGPGKGSAFIFEIPVDAAAPRTEASPQLGSSTNGAAETNGVTAVPAVASRPGKGPSPGAPSPPRPPTAA